MGMRVGELSRATGAGLDEDLASRLHEISTRLLARSAASCQA